MRKINVITRCSYNQTQVEGFDLEDKSRVLTNNRLELFQSNLIHSLKKQTFKNFSFTVIVGSHKPSIDRIKSLDYGGLNVNFIQNTKQLDIAEVQVQIDSDDIALPGWIEHINKSVNENTKNTFLLNYMPVKLRQTDGATFKPYAKYSDSYPSMFTVIVQKEDKKYPAYHVTHTKWHKVIPNIVTISEPFVYLVVHEENVLSNIQEGKDTPL